MATHAALRAAIEAGDRATAVRIAREVIEAGEDPRSIMAAMSEAMTVVGDRFQRNEIYIPEMLICARAMKEATAVLEPVLVGAGIRPEHTAVIGTIQGDLHDIGKNLVAMMWKGANIEVVDLGTDVPAERFAEAAKEYSASIVGISALLTTTMGRMHEAVAAVRAAGSRIKVIVGGAPVTQDYASQIGADGYAPDAATAVDVAQEMLRG